MNNLLPGLAQRLAALTRDSVQSTGAVAAIAEQLPEFQPGERYTARILQNLRDGLMRADIGGRSVTLRLPQSIPEGQTVTLTHVSRSAQTWVATLDGDGQASGESADLADAPVKLSLPARTIASLLEDKPPQPVRLGQDRPMIEPARMPAPGSAVSDADIAPQIATRLAQAISNSGLFYESHQADWVSGRRPLESTAAEPQRAFDPSRSAPEARPPALSGMAVPDDLPANGLVGTAADAAGAGQKAEAEGAPLRLETAARERNDARGLETAPPGELRPLVHNQLLGLSQHTLAWDGLAWPGQAMRIEIDDPEADGRPQTADEADAASRDLPWTTRVRMVLPGLGEVETTLTLWKDHGVNLSIAADENARLRLAIGVMELQQRMSDAGLQLGSVNFSRMLEEARNASADEDAP